MATLQQEAQTKGTASDANVAKVAHKLEVLVIPYPMSTARSSSTRVWVGGSMPTTTTVATSA